MYNLFKVIPLLIILMSCHKKIYLSGKLNIHYTSGNSEKELYSWYFDKFGEKKYIKSRRDTLLSVHNIFPSFLFLGANNKIHQPIIIQPKKRINIKKKGDRHFINSQINECNYQLSEELETSFGTAHLGELLGTNDPPIEEFLFEDAYKNIRFITSQKYLLNEQLEYINTFQSHNEVDKSYLEVVISMINDYYMLRLILQAMSIESDTLALMNDLNTEILTDITQSKYFEI